MLPRLYFLGDVNEASSVPWRLRDRSAVQNIPGVEYSDRRDLAGLPQAS